MRSIAKKLDDSIESALVRMRPHGARVTNRDFPGIVDSMDEFDSALDNMTTLIWLIEKTLWDADFINRRAYDAPPSMEV